MNNLENKLKKIVNYYQNSESVGLLYSGGLDSTIIAYLLTNNYPAFKVNIVSVGFPNSYDMKNASFGAKELGFNLYKRFLTIELIMGVIKRLKRFDIIHNPVHLSVAIPLYLGLEVISERYKTKTIFLGQGADELFVGYKRYSLLFKEKKIDDISLLMAKDLKSLLEDQKKVEEKLGDHFGVHLIYPYLNPEIIKHAQSYPIGSHIVLTDDGKIVRKVLLRELAKNLGLSDSLVYQEKKAIQYGSGTIKALRKLAKLQGYSNIHEWFYSHFIS